MKILQINTAEKQNHFLTQILAEFIGEDLAGTTYEQFIPWFYQQKILKKLLE